MSLTTTRAAYIADLATEEKCYLLVETENDGSMLTNVKIFPSSGLSDKDARLEFLEGIRRLLCVDCSGA